MDVNNKKYSKQSILAYHIFFLFISSLCVIFLPKGVNESFIDYIKDIFAIFVGFFVTALTLIYDKLNISKIPSHNSSLKFEIMAKQLYVASQRVL